MADDTQKRITPQQKRIAMMTVRVALKAGSGVPSARAPKIRLNTTGYGLKSPRKRR